MTDEERDQELAADTIEDLEAPAAEQGDVVGGRDQCATPTCVGHTAVKVYCRGVTCTATAQECPDILTGILIVKEM
jgi:hypothetical protein